MEALPKSIIIVGGGVIGIEWASMLNDFGVEVTVIEYADRIIPTEDDDISKEMKKLLTKKGITFATGAKGLTRNTRERRRFCNNFCEINGETKEFTAEKMLVSVGRQANVEGIGIDNTEIQVENGFIQRTRHSRRKKVIFTRLVTLLVDFNLHTLLHMKGLLRLNISLGLKINSMDYTKISRCIYSSPEASSVGITEKQAKEQGFDVKVGKFPFMAIGKALVNGNSDGFVKIIADKKTE